MMSKSVTYEERQLMAIYNTGTRKGLLDELIHMQQYLSSEEVDLKNLTTSAMIATNAAIQNTTPITEEIARGTVENAVIPSIE